MDDRIVLDNHDDPHWPKGHLESEETTRDTLSLMATMPAGLAMMVSGACHFGIPFRPHSRGAALLMRYSIATFFVCVMCA